MPGQKPRLTRRFFSTPNVDIPYDISADDFDPEIKSHHQLQSLVKRWQEKALRGDVNACESLHRAAFLIISAMLEIEEKNRAVAESVAAKRLTWPVLLTTVSEHNADALASAKALGLGLHADRNYDATKDLKSEESVTKPIARNLARIIDGLRDFGKVQAEIAQLKKIPAAELTRAKRAHLKTLSSNHKGETVGRRALQALANGFGTQNSWENLIEKSFVEKALRLPVLKEERFNVWARFAYLIFTHITGGKPEEIEKLKALVTEQVNSVDGKRGKIRDLIKKRIVQSFKNQVKFAPA